MIQVYTHIVPADSVNGMLEHMGIEPECRIVQLPHVAKPIQCQHCGIVNLQSSLFCNGCGRTMSYEAKATLESSKRFIHEYQLHHEIAHALFLPLEMKQGEV